MTQIELDYMNTMIHCMRDISDSQKKIADSLKRKKITLSDIKQYAQKQNTIGIEIENSFITNPWESEDGKVSFNTERTVKFYGAENVINYCLDIVNELIK